VKAIFGPAGNSTSVSARRLARKSRLSMTAEVKARRFTIEPLRGCQRTDAVVIASGARHRRLRVFQIERHRLGEGDEHADWLLDEAARLMELDLSLFLDGGVGHLG
jgi:hypothetical protein